MGVLVFQIVIAIIIFLATQVGATSKNITIVVLFLFTLVMVKTSSLMGIQFLTIIISALIFKSRESKQQNLIRRVPLINHINKFDTLGGNRSPEQIKQHREKIKKQKLIRNVEIFFQLLGCILFLLLVGYVLSYIFF